MKFNPSDAGEGNTRKGPTPLEDGVYSFTVGDASERISAKGNEMLVVELAIPLREGGERNVRDYITDAATWKLKQLCEAVGLADEFARGEITPTMIYKRTGKVELRTQAATDAYPARNKVHRYHPGEQSTPQPAPQQHAPISADDIPF